jgi:hypothetical protein
MQLLLGVAAQLPVVALSRLSSEVCSSLLLLLPWYESDLEPVGWDLVTACVGIHIQHIPYIVTHIARNLRRSVVDHRMQYAYVIPNTIASQRNCQV